MLLLGPILFLIYINSLLTLTLEATIISYADDTVIIFNVNVNLCAEVKGIVVRRFKKLKIGQI